MPSYPETLRKKMVQKYQEQWQESQITIEQFADQNRIHHTTMRKWIKAYSPEFDSQRRSKKTYREVIVEEQAVQKQMQVQTEWYPHEPEPEQTKTGVAEPDHAEHRINQLLKEIEFLKQQVSYWMQQEPVVL